MLTQHKKAFIVINVIHYVLCHYLTVPKGLRNNKMCGSGL